MELGWIDFSKTDRDKVKSVLDLLGEKGVLDELGIAQIRDGFANLFFPGTTTIQTRAKYFLIVPYIFEDLRLNSTNDFSKLKKQLNDKERDCGKKFLKINEVEEDNEDSADYYLITDDDEVNDERGVIGKRSIRQGKWVKRAPSSIYWAGLKKYGIFKKDISIEEYLKEISDTKSSKVNTSNLGNRNDSSEGGHDDVDAGDTQNSHSFNIPTYNKGWFENLEMDLTMEEGSFLKKQIRDSCPSSMLKIFLENSEDEKLRNILENGSFADLESVDYLFEEDLKTSFGLAKKFSEFVLVLRILFNIIAYEGEDENRILKEANKRFDEKRDELKKIADVDFQRIYELLDIKDSRLISFLGKAQKFMEEENIDELKNCIKEREISLKGENRSKTCHHIKFDDTWLAGDELNYRFGNVKVIIGDIFKSEEQDGEKLEIKEET